MGVLSSLRGEVPVKVSTGFGPMPADTDAGHVSALGVASTTHGIV